MKFVIVVILYKKLVLLTLISPSKSKHLSKEASYRLLSVNRELKLESKFFGNFVNPKYIRLSINIK